MLKKGSVDQYPGWDSTMYHWSLARIRQRKKSLPSYLTVEDCLGEFYVIYLKYVEGRCRSKSKKMAYFKKAIDSWLNSQSVQIKCDVVEADEPEEYLSNLLTSTGNVTVSSGPLRVKIGKSAGVIRDLVALFFTDDGKKILESAYTLRFKNGDRETNNQLLCRLLGVNQIDLFTIMKEYFHDG